VIEAKEEAEVQAELAEEAEADAEEEAAGEAEGAEASAEAEEPVAEAEVEGEAAASAEAEEPAAEAEGESELAASTEEPAEAETEPEAPAPEEAPAEEPVPAAAGASHARDPITILAHQLVALGPKKELRVLLRQYHGRTGQPLNAAPQLVEVSRVARFFHHKAVGGQAGNRETLMRLPEEQSVVIFAHDGDVISVHEDVANTIFPVIARNRASWEGEAWEAPTASDESATLSFDQWA
ncbi:MAG TPA: hypothetical protein VF099_15485, partial [Ktedonobacterales bacterium]